MRRLAALLIAVAALPVRADLFVSDSKRFGESKMDIVVAELERLPRASVLDIRIRSVGSSVGSSFFLLCSVRDLARVRGGFRYVAKVEGQPKSGQMVVGFLRSGDEPPEATDARLAGQTVIDLEQFAPICERMK